MKIEINTAKVHPELNDYVALKPVNMQKIKWLIATKMIMHK